MEQQPHQPWQGAPPPGGSAPSYPPPYAQPYGQPYGHAYGQPLPYHQWPGDPYQQARDAEHLRLLSICHYVWGGIAAVFSMCGLFYVFMGFAFANDPSAFNNTGSGAGGGNPPPPEFMGYMFIGMGSAIILLGSVVGGLTIYSGRCLAQRRGRGFSMVVAGINCLSVPIGTVLGVFTFMVLTRDSVRSLYASPPPRPPGTGAGAGPYA